jgi:glutamate carboxypeptidase
VTQFDVDALVADLGRLVNVESPSLDVAAIEESAQAVAEMINDRLGSPPELVTGPAGPHVHWRGGNEPQVLIVGHHDTVFPRGTLAARPFTVRDGRATGPGVFDMKGGIVIAIHAVASLADRGGVELLLTCDEEVGSLTSRPLIEKRAAASGRVLVLEPAADGGALKVGRKGVGMYDVEIIGRAAHAGLEPEKGVNALVEAAHQVLAIEALARPELGTTVTPTMANAGTAENVVPAHARVRVDVRVTSLDEADRVDKEIGALTPVDPQATISVSGGVNRPPMPTETSTDLFAVAQQAAQEVGIGLLEGVSVGGGSDGNFTAALGIPTLDGLGVVGGGAHADHEWVDVPSLAERAGLLAAILRRLTTNWGSGESAAARGLPQKPGRQGSSPDGGARSGRVGDR